MRRLAATRSGQRGLSLIELMVGIAVGLLTTLVIAQTLAVAEAQKRSTTSGSDAQVNGALALYALSRELQMAGYGLGASQGALGCTIKARYNGTDFSWTLAPVQITAGVNGAPDALRVLGSDKPSYSVVALVVKDHPRSAANFFINSGLGIADGDMMLAVPQAWDATHWCSVFQVTDDKSGPGKGLGNNQVVHNAGQSGWNQPGGQTIFPDDGYPEGSLLVNLGRFSDRRYRVDAARSLQQVSFDTADGSSATRELAPQIVQLQAYYGKDTDADGTVDAYDKVSPATQAAWQQVLTVKLALVARSAQPEREDVTLASPQWNVGAGSVTVAGAAACGSAQCVTLKIDDLPEWRRYRYKVYETTVPLRNMLWHS